ncbi:metalloregulator ArsR/SmtB family transcription factor [Pullulanibacillus sp. KACC 23026]|uniref:ArsR/SmtB family transcription factor n=1 Tax=Pullulanibacillus sp. KACC 23026 TaxID=3028315 RepID=UPI0023B11BED|nr:metalloregulator ArsR/SmtB family transcription factor [Pullulanibacillus sp. KACC 23026]WEG12176.1 metalloregulator ArsR/SmtB family transcription factor [Pullulanibacillus sp. KACC 23026]
MSAEQHNRDVFQAISDPTRRSLLKLLADQEMPIAAIVAQFPITRTAINKHLHILSEAGLVRSQKVGRETRFTLQPEPLVELKQWLSFFETYWENKLDALKELVEKETH